MFGSEPAWPRLQTKGSILDNICLTGLVETVSLEPGISGAVRGLAALLNDPQTRN